MRKLLGLAAMCCMALALLLSEQVVAQDDAGPMAVETVVLETAQGGFMIAAEMATTPALRERGLMFRHRLPSDRGMLLVYESPQIISLWMKNTLISLDMIFLAADGRVVSVFTDAVPGSEEIVASGVPALAVLEVAAGTVSRIGLTVGDRAIHPVFGNSE